MNELDRINSEIERLVTKISPLAARLDALYSAMASKISPLTARLDALYSARRKEKSRLFIEVNNITKGCVQRHVGEGVPWLEDIFHFGEWLKVNSDKKWCEWCDTLYLTSEVIQGRMDVSAVGRYEDLPD